MTLATISILGKLCGQLRAKVIYIRHMKFQQGVSWLSQIEVGTAAGLLVVSGVKIEFTVSSMETNFEIALY